MCCCCINVFTRKCLHTKLHWHDKRTVSHTAYRGVEAWDRFQSPHSWTDSQTLPLREGELVDVPLPNLHMHKGSCAHCLTALCALFESLYLNPTEISVMFTYHGLLGIVIAVIGWNVLESLSVTAAGDFLLWLFNARLQAIDIAKGLWVLWFFLMYIHCNVTNKEQPTDIKKKSYSSNRQTCWQRGFKS